MCSVDNYYKSQRSLQTAKCLSKNFDHPDVIDHKLLISDVKKMLMGEAVEIPVYNFNKHLRESYTIRLPSAEIIFLEGLFALYHKELVSLACAKVFVDCDPDIRVVRRIRRDIRERGRTLDDILEQYVSTTAPMHKRFVEPTKKVADLIVSGNNRPGQSISKIKDFLQSKLL